MERFYSLLTDDDLIESLEIQMGLSNVLYKIFKKTNKKIPITIYNLIVAENLSKKIKLTKIFFNSNKNNLLRIGKTYFGLGKLSDGKIIKNTERILELSLEMEPKSLEISSSKPRLILTKKSIDEKPKKEKGEENEGKKPKGEENEGKKPKGEEKENEGKKPKGEEKENEGKKPKGEEEKPKKEEKKSREDEKSKKEKEEKKSREDEKSKKEKEEKKSREDEKSKKEKEEKINNLNEKLKPNMETLSNLNKDLSKKTELIKSKNFIKEKAITNPKLTNIISQLNKIFTLNQEILSSFKNESKISGETFTEAERKNQETAEIFKNVVDGNDFLSFSFEKIIGNPEKPDFEFLISDRISDKIKEILNDIKTQIYELRKLSPEEPYVKLYDFYEKETKNTQENEILEFMDLFSSIKNEVDKYIGIPEAYKILIESIKLRYENRSGGVDQKITNTQNIIKDIEAFGGEIKKFENKKFSFDFSKINQPKTSDELKKAKEDIKTMTKTLFTEFYEKMVSQETLERNMNLILRKINLLEDNIKYFTDNKLDKTDDILKQAKKALDDFSLFREDFLKNERFDYLNTEKISMETINLFENKIKGKEEIALTKNCISEFQELYNDMYMLKSNIFSLRQENFVEDKTLNDLKSELESAKGTKEEFLKFNEKNLPVIAQIIETLKNNILKWNKKIFLFLEILDENSKIPILEICLDKKIDKNDENFPSISYAEDFINFFSYITIRPFFVPIQLIISENLLKLMKIEEILKEADESKKPIAASVKSGGVWKRGGAKSPISEISGWLNKLNLETFDEKTTRILSLVGSDDKLMEETAILIFNKAVLEISFIPLYTQLCVKIWKSSEKGKIFRTTLLEKCQQEFEIRIFREREEDETKEDYFEKEIKFKKRFVGIVVFMGELYNVDMVTSKPVMGMIKTLLPTMDLENPPTYEEIEYVSNLLTTSGKKLDQNSETKKDLDKIFIFFKKLVDDKKLASRSYVLVKNIIELRDKKWITKKTG